jgi:phosphatidylinositol kinase/protein kinase (PI-3  family)
MVEALKLKYAKKENLIRRIEKQIDLEKQMVETMIEEQQGYIQKSVLNYLKVLETSDYKNEYSIFRVLSLWFSNSMNENINSIMDEYLQKIESRKFIDLMYQLSARLVSQDPDQSEFYKILLKLVLRVVLDYPFHTLSYIITLKNVSKDKRGSQISSKAVKLFLEEVKKSRALHQIAYQMDTLFSAYIETAYQVPPKNALKDPSKQSTLESGSALLKINADCRMPVVTACQELPAPKDYSGGITIVKFESKYTIPGGINAPKVIKCLGSDGQIYKQLVKGNGKRN